MIPLEIELENFLAYRDPGPIDLRGLHLACLAGANGAGKSSLLDAITWALWGKARTRRDDDLIHAAEEEMHVQLTFLLDGNCYRVLRYRTRKGRGRSELHVEVQDGEDWRLLDEPTIRETQARINSLLHLDYETFINSAFLMQGRADEFTQKTPGDRKVILGEILGLDVWAEYEEQAKLALRAIEAEIGQIDHEIVRIVEELGREAEYEQELAAARQRRDALGERAAEAQQYVDALRSAERTRDALRDQRMGLQRRIARDEGDLTRLADERARLQARLAAHEATAEQREAIEEGFRQLQAAREVVAEMSRRMLEQNDLRERRSEVQRAIDAIRSRLEAEQADQRTRIAKLERMLADGADRPQTLAEQRQRAEELAGREADRDLWRAEMQALLTERAALEAENRTLKREMDHLESQRDQIVAADAATCPLCEQPLSAEHRAELLARLERDGTEKADQFRANRQRLEALGSEAETLDGQIKRADSELRTLPPVREHIARLEAALEQAEAAREELEQATVRLAEVDAALAGQDFAAEERAALAEIEGELTALGYDAEAHRQANAVVQEFGRYEGEKASLDLVLEEMPDMQARLVALDASIAERGEGVAEDRAALAALEEQVAAVEAEVEALAPWDAELSALRDQYGEAQVRVGWAEQRLYTLGQQRERREHLNGQREALTHRQGAYEQLREAFGKDGIPAMIIEATIPEIETEANDILTQMTDGQMHVRFDTQREKVTGGTKETLDILIADALGTRDYEMFSGGEAFRVDFAIRLALSRLLARRAGAQLRTLIIDEGFGTQDAQGRERLVQAITTIKDDFDLILVITHIDELKDAFPVRIEITKTPAGSMVEIV